MTTFLRFGLLFVMAYMLPSSQSLISREEISHDKFIIHAIPKCGTHLIERMITLLTDKNIHTTGLSLETLKDFENRHLILRIFQGYNSSAINFLEKNDYKAIAMIRDPRDALISFVFYMREYKGCGQRRDFFFVSPNFDELSFDEQLTALIEGGYGMLSYLNFYGARAGWSLDPYCLRIKYEDLVGKEGGGNNELQLQAILDIAQYLNIELTDSKLQFILDNIYVKTGNDVMINKNVFTRASKGNWSNFFNQKHRDMFKRAAGKLLIDLGYEKDYNW